MIRKTFIFISLLLLMVNMPSVAQLLRTSVMPVNTCPGSYQVVIYVENFSGVGAISLNLNYNSSQVTYQGYTNLNDSLIGGFTLINAANGQVIISWASVEPATIGNDTLVELKFSSGYGSFPFNWNTGTPGYCEYVDNNGTVIPSVFVNGTATVIQPPVIVQQPVDKIAYVGANTSFYVGVSGGGIGYQWQLSTNGGNSWSNLTNAPPYSGVTNSTLSVSSVITGLSGNRYRCQNSGTCPPPVTSNAATLLVYDVIQTAAPNMNTCAGGVTAAITVQHCNSVGAISLKINYNPILLSYAGYQNVNPVFLAGSYFLKETNGEIIFSWAGLNPVNPGSAVLFELNFNSIVGNAFLNWNTSAAGNCEYSDVYGNVIYSTYTNGTINTLPPPAITGQPVNKSIIAGQNTSFSVSATGSGLGYQWQVSTDEGNSFSNLANGTPYSGVTSSTLSITGATQGMSGNKYRCAVSGTCPPPVTSNFATLTVTPAIPAITTNIGSISNSCKGNLAVPVNVLNCNNVGAISLALNFNPAQISFDGYESPHPDLANGMLVVNGISGKVILSWASTTPVNITNGTLINFRFIIPSGSSSLSWDTQTQAACEYADPAGNVIPGIFNNGTVSVISNPLIANAGPDVTITQGNSTTLNGTATGGSGTKTYSWSPATYLSNPNIANPVASPPSTITYSLTVTAGSCQASNNVTITVQPLQGFSLHLTTLLEGPFEGPNMANPLISLADFPLSQSYNVSPWNYSGNEQVTNLPNSNIVDWILVELRDASSAVQATSSTMIARKAAFLLDNGAIVGMDGTGDLSFNVSVNQSLFVVLWHRNHLGVMSALPLTQAGGVYSYDFTTDAEKAYGGANAQKQLAPGKWGMFSGDGDANRLIDLIDKTGTWSPNAGKTGYLNADFNLDGQVDNRDKNEFWLPNLEKSSQVPE